MNSLYPYLLILFPTLAIFTVVFLVMSRYRGYVEEEPLGEIRTISPALKIIKLIFSKTITSIEIVIIVVSLYLLTIMASSIASYTYSMRTIDLEGMPHIFDVAGVSNTIDDIDRVIQARYTIVVIQMYRTLIFNVSNKTLMFYPLLIGCNKDAELKDNISSYVKLLIDLCVALKTNNLIILNKNLGIPVQEISLPEGIKYTIITLDLKPLLDLELIPGMYILHSIGSIGGETIKLEDVNRIALLRMTQGNIDILCKGKCDAKIIALYIDTKKSSSLNNTIDEYRNIFNHVIVRRYNTGMVYSNTFIPTPESIVGLLILFLISIVILLSLSGGLIEKLSYVVNKLLNIGISKELYGASSILTLTIIFSIAAVPIAISHYVGWLHSFGFVAYLIMSVATIFILSNQLTRKLNIVQHLPQRSSATYIAESYISVENLKKCLTQLLSNDDFFHLNEIEVLENSKYFVLRLEMVYRIALSTIASSEIYVESYDGLWRYVVEVDVWSIEEFTAREVRYITLLALSKIYGGLTSCLERSS